jgi:hypothetical protein
MNLLHDSPCALQQAKRDGWQSRQHPTVKEVHEDSGLSTDLQKRLLAAAGERPKSAVGEKSGGLVPAEKQPSASDEP